jgi:hypothetical protein
MEEQKNEKKRGTRRGRWLRKEVATKRREGRYSNGLILFLYYNSINIYFSLYLVAPNNSLFEILTDVKMTKFWVVTPCR